jgi:DNA-binding protein HU-beta
MNRQELAAAVAEESDLSAKQADAVVGAVLSSIADAVSKGDKVTLSGFGTFERRHRAARTGRNPQTGDTIEIAASNAPAFKPAAAFKRAVADA